MGELLLELLSEEIPARMQRRAIEDLTGLIRDKLAAANISAASLAGYVTPRRLVVIADGIPARQPDREEERRGPRVGAPEQALSGFLRAAGLTSIDQCEMRGEFYFAVIKRLGRATAEVLPEAIHAAMTALPWPKSMRYPASELRWVRPLNSVICLFDGEVLKLPLGEVPVGRTTRGHRFLSQGEISVANAADYREKLAKAHVVLDWKERREIIAKGLEKLASAEGLTVKPDEGLLDEVAGLVEYPIVLLGTIDADFVRPLPDGLPPEVLATAMRTHQKYFTCLNADGTPAPRFLFVANNKTADNGAAIVAGNERVLRARLSDAKFFWDQDRKIRLEDRVEALKQRVYHEKLGSVYDKVERMEKLAAFLADQLAPQLVTPAKAGAQGDRTLSALDSRLRGNDDQEAGAQSDFKERAVRAAHLAKADLSTGMVGEFPELQGIMGRYYALNDGLDARTAGAIAEHYKPLGPNDSCPNAPESIAVALADKIDALTAFFAIGERPTGSGDPFALRRAAQGVIRLISENDLRVPLRSVFSLASRTISEGAGSTHSGSADDFEVAKATGSLIAFIFDRLRVHARDQGISQDVIEAAQRPGRVETLSTSRLLLQEDDLTRFLRRIRALRIFLQSDDGTNLLTAYRRASNIVTIEERRDGRRYNDKDDDPHLLDEAEESRNLGRALGEVGGLAGELLRKEKFEDAMAALAKLRQPIDEFFERVTVNADDAKLRENRLRLLARIRSTMNQIADFSQIEG